MGFIKNTIIVGLIVFFLVVMMISFDISYTGEIVGANFSASYFVAHPDEVIADYNTKFENIPNFARTLLGNERINLVINMSDGSVKNFGLITKEGKIIELNKDSLNSPTFVITTSERVIDEVAKSSNAGQDFADAILNDKIKVEGIGFMPQTKIFSAKTYLKANGWAK